MSRKRTIEAAAINIRCHSEHSAAEYTRLIQFIGQRRSSIGVYGSTHLLLYPPETNRKGMLTGLIAKFTRIDMEAEWIDLRRRQIANENQIDRIVIPKNLAPHGALLEYIFYPKEHLFVFQSKSKSVSLSPGLMLRYFEKTAESADVADKFGALDITIVPTEDSLEKVLSIYRLRRLRLKIQRPNPDHLPSARRMFERLERQKAESLQEEYVAQRGMGLEPDSETKHLAELARDNGRVEGEGTNQEGAKTFESTTEHPLREVESIDDNIESERSVFRRTATRILENWRQRPR